MIGFSAGAGATMATTLHSDQVDLAFIGPIYGDMQAVEVPDDAPPLFAVIATDDFLFGGEFGLIKSWYDAGKPVEFHIYRSAKRMRTSQNASRIVKWLQRLRRSGIAPQQPGTWIKGKTNESSLAPWG